MYVHGVTCKGGFGILSYILHEEVKSNQDQIWARGITKA